MRLTEIEKLSFPDAKEIVTDLEHSKGRVKDVAARNSWLVQMCQQAIREKFGENFSVYRGVILLDNQELKNDSVASTSLSIEVVLHILGNKEGIYWTGSHMGHRYMQLHQTNKMVFLHYRMTPDRVVLWIPYILPIIRAAVGKRINHGVENRYGGKYKIEQILQWIEKWNEQEVVANLSGLQPKVLPFDSNVIGKEKLAWFKGWLEGKSLDQFEKFANITLQEFQNWTEEFHHWTA